MLVCSLYEMLSNEEVRYQFLLGFFLLCWAVSEHYFDLRKTLLNNLFIYTHTHTRTHTHTHIQILCIYL